MNVKVKNAEYLDRFKCSEIHVNMFCSLKLTFFMDFHLRNLLIYEKMLKLSLKLISFFNQHCKWLFVFFFQLSKFS